MGVVMMACSIVASARRTAIERGGCRHPAAQEPVLELAVEDGDADAIGGEHVAAAAAVDEAVGVGGAGPSLILLAVYGWPRSPADVPAKAFVGEAGDGAAGCAGRRSEPWRVT